MASNAKKSPNKIEICDECIKIFDLNGDFCTIDKNDYDNVKEYRWCKDGYGYWMSRTFGRAVKIHRLICDVDDANLIIDHINKDISDNRRCNLRIVDKKANAYNHKLNKNNDSGFVGVRERKLSNGDSRWDANISVSYKTKYLGSYLTFEEAMKARLNAEANLFGEYAPQRHLFELCGVCINE